MNILQSWRASESNKFQLGLWSQLYSILQTDGTADVVESCPGLWFVVYGLRSAFCGLLLTALFRLLRARSRERYSYRTSSMLSYATTRSLQSPRELLDRNLFNRGTGLTI